MSRETFQSLRMLLMEKLDLARELTDEEILEEIDTLILERMRDSCLSLKEKVQLRQELFHSVRKLDVLQELIEDETVTEIMVNGPDAIFVERAGKLSRWEKTFTSGEKLEDVIQADRRKMQTGWSNESNAYCGCPSGERSQSECGGPPGCIEWSDTDDPPFSGYTDHHGKTDRAWKSACGMCGISENTGQGKIFHGHWRRNRKWKNNVSWSTVQFYTQ